MGIYEFMSALYIKTNVIKGYMIKRVVQVFLLFKKRYPKQFLNFLNMHLCLHNIFVVSQDIER